MGTLILYLAITIVGYFVGNYVRKRGNSLSWTGKVQTVAIIILVFVMGSRIGSNEEVVSSLDSIGLVALALTIIIDVFSIAAVSISRRLLGFDKYGLRRNGEEVSGSQHIEEGDKAKGGINKMTIYICISVALGIAAGYLLLPEWFINITGNLLTIALCILLLFVGIDIGSEGTLVSNFKAAGLRVIIFPFASMVGMMAGALVAALIMAPSIQDMMCIGAGFGWYSLAPAMLATYSIQVSAISFMHNVFRELISILFIPFVANRIGYIECTCLPGAAAMDVCLPIVERATRSDVAVISFISGVVLSVAVPVMVSLFMAI